MRGKQPSGIMTQKKMLKAAVGMFLEKGYEKTTTAEIARAAGMTPSSFFRAYESKEALLLELVKQMFDGQFAEAERLISFTEKPEPLFMYALETAIQLHIVELSEPLRDLYISAYSLPSTTEYIYKRMTKKLAAIFAAYLPHAQEKDFFELEIASGSITRGFMSVKCDVYFTMELKLRRYLDCCLKLYDVPENVRNAVIEKALAMDIRSIAESIIAETVRRAESYSIPDGSEPRIAGVSPIGTPCIDTRSDPTSSTYASMEVSQ